MPNPFSAIGTLILLFAACFALSLCMSLIYSAKRNEGATDEEPQPKQRIYYVEKLPAKRKIRRRKRPDIPLKDTIIDKRHIRLIPPDEE